MKIISAMVVKNEADIVRQTILKALKWSDYIIVMDNGSDDGTIDILKELDQHHENFIFWGVYGGKYKSNQWGIIYDDFKHLSSIGDWWCRLDSDEFFIDDPREFLSNIEKNVDHVYAASFTYLYTDKDLEKEKDADYKNKPIEDRLKYYECDFKEIRFAKITKNLVWPLNRAWPIFFNASKRRIRLKHFRYRSIEQMKIRKSIRSDSFRRGKFKYEQDKNQIVDHSKYTYDDGSYSIDSYVMPRPSHACWTKKIRNYMYVLLSKSKHFRRDFGL